MGSQTKKQQQLHYAAKVKATRDPPTRKVFEEHWTNRWGQYNDNTAPIYCKVRDFFMLKNDILGRPRDIHQNHHGEERNSVLTFQYLKKETKNRTRNL